MSFVRPEIAAAARRWRETAFWSALTLGGFFWLLGDGVFRIAVALIWGAVGLWLVRSALLSALAAGRAAAPGVVTIDERRISYFGPHQGGVAALDDIGRIGIGFDGREGRGAVWRLWSVETETMLTIPVAAIGAGGLIDAFAALPGFAPARALGALSTAGRGGRAGVTIWRRDGAPVFAALARGGGAD